MAERNIKVGKKTTKKRIKVEKNEDESFQHFI